jgi:FAD/FMN-containing dehydrogenase
MVIEQTNEALSRGAVQALRSRVRGPVIAPTDTGYEDARVVWNGMIDRRPAAIVGVRDASDVAAAVQVATAHNVTLAVRGGGHNVAGSAVADAAIVIDLRNMRSVSVDARARTAHAQGGATLGEVDSATQPHGLAVPIGVVTETGIAGLTLGGGLGWLRRKHGLTVDNLLGAEVVLADGRIVRASANENDDLFWAIRGGGGNFGVVTEFEFEAHPVGPQVPFAFVFIPLEAGVRGLKFFREYMQTVPDELSTFAIVGGVPDAEMFPEEVRGRDALIFAACWVGDAAEGDRILRPLRTFATPLVDMSGTWSYREQVQTLFDEDYPNGGRYYWKSQYIDALMDEAIEGLVDAGFRRPSKASTIDLWHLGGAIARVPADATPVPQRQAQYLIGIEANWDAGDTHADAENVAWARELWAATQRWSPAGVYVNFAGFGEEGTDLVRAAYGANYARLAKIKAKYDPANVFRVNQNIKPAT